MCDGDAGFSRRVLLAAAAVPLGVILAGCTDGTAAPPPTTAGTPTPHLEPVRHTTRTDVADLTDPRSLRLVVNKRRPLRPTDWVPQDLAAPQVRHTNAPQLRRPAARALEQLFQAAARDGITLFSLSAYRPFTVQRRIFDRNLATLGRAATEKLTLRPGYSEHQTGLAVDIGGVSRRTDLDVAFGRTAEAAWLRTHAWRHGWLLRYEQGRKPVTGIQYEPWHYRFVGKDLAAAYRASGAHTLEQYFHLPAAPGYA